MGVLDLIWQISLSLSLAALLIFVILFWRRLWLELNQNRRRQQETEVRQRLFTLMLKEADSDGYREVAEIPARQRRPALETAVKLCHLVRGHERDLLTQFMRDMNFLADCLRDIDHSDVQRRHTAATALQFFEEKQAIKALNNALDDESSRVRMAAADSLLLHNALPPVDILAVKLSEKALLKTHDARHLFRDIARRDVDTLHRLARMPKLDYELKKLAVDAMGEAVEFSVLPLLAKFLCDPSAEVRAIAAQALGSLGHPRASNSLRRGLSDHAWAVRVACVQAIAQIGLEDLAPRVQPLVKDENWWVKLNAGKCLSELGQRGREALNELQQDMASNDQFVDLILEEYNARSGRVC